MKNWKRKGKVRYANRSFNQCVVCCDRRTHRPDGAALVIAGLAAQGVSVLEDIVYIKRGYEDFAEKLTSLGGIIEEVETEKDIQRFRLKNGTTNW